MTNSSVDLGPMPEYRWTSPLSMAVFWLALSALGAVAFFWDGFVSLVEAWSRPEYSYGPMVPLITAYMSLREYNHRPPIHISSSRIPGILFFGFGLLLGLLGNLSKIPDFVTYGFIVCIGGLILIIAGYRAGIRHWPGWLHLFFMLPLPSIIYWQISTKLQIVSSELGVFFIASAGVPVFLNGNVIDLGVYQLLVAEACSGLRYLFPLLSFGWLFAVLYNGPNWHRVILFLSTIPITVVMNSLRIGIIGVLVNSFGIGQAEGFLHFFEGWIIFLSCTIILYIEAWILRSFLAGRGHKGHIIDVDFQGIVGPIRKFAGLGANKTLIAATVMIIAAGALWQIKPGGGNADISRRAFHDFPLSIAGWQGSPVILDESIERVLGADDYMQANYVYNQQAVNLFMTFYQKQTEGSGIHSPEVCLPGGGWEVSQWTQKEVSLDGDASHSVNLNRAIIRRNESRQLVYYWFEQRGRRMTNDVNAKLLSILDTVMIGRSDGGLVRLTTVIQPTETLASAEARLAGFLKIVLPSLPEYFPPREIVQAAASQ